MIVFNECTIAPDGKYLIVEASVNNLSYYDNVYIKSVIVDTEDTYTQSGTPQSSPLVEFKEADKKKHIRLCWKAKDLNVDNLSNHIFIVYVGAIGYPSPDTPCNCQNEYSMSVAVNLRPIYNGAMKYIKELESGCTIPVGMIDFILRLKAFKLSLKTGNLFTAFKYWKWLLKDKFSSVVTNKCGCHGIN